MCIVEFLLITFRLDQVHILQYYSYLEIFFLKPACYPCSCIVLVTSCTIVLYCIDYCTKHPKWSINVQEKKKRKHIGGVPGKSIQSMSCEMELKLATVFQVISTLTTGHVIKWWHHKLYISSTCTVWTFNHIQLENMFHFGKIHFVQLWCTYCWVTKITHKIWYSNHV